MIVQTVADAKKFADFATASKIVQNLYKAGGVKTGRCIEVMGSVRDGFHIAVSETNPESGVQVLVGRLA